MFFKGLAGCVRERKMYQNTSKMIPTSIPQSTKSRSRIYARKSDAKNKENHSKWSSKGIQKQ